MSAGPGVAFRLQSETIINVSQEACSSPTTSISCRPSKFASTTQATRKSCELVQDSINGIADPVESKHDSSEDELYDVSPTTQARARALRYSANAAGVHGERVPPPSDSLMAKSMEVIPSSIAETSGVHEPTLDRRSLSQIQVVAPPTPSKSQNSPILGDTPAVNIPIERSSSNQDKTSSDQVDACKVTLPSMFGAHIYQRTTRSSALDNLKARKALKHRKSTRIVQLSDKVSKSNSQATGAIAKTGNIIGNGSATDKPADKHTQQLFSGTKLRTGKLPVVKKRAPQPTQKKAKPEPKANVGTRKTASKQKANSVQSQSLAKSLATRRKTEIKLSLKPQDVVADARDGNDLPLLALSGCTLGVREKTKYPVLPFLPKDVQCPQDSLLGRTIKSPDNIAAVAAKKSNIPVGLIEIDEQENSTMTPSKQKTGSRTILSEGSANRSEPISSLISLRRPICNGDQTPERSSDMQHNAKNVKTAQADKRLSLQRGVDVPLTSAKSKTEEGLNDILKSEVQQEVELGPFHQEYRHLNKNPITQRCVKTDEECQSEAKKLQQVQSWAAESQYTHQNANSKIRPSNTSPQNNKAGTTQDNPVELSDNDESSSYADSARTSDTIPLAEVNASPIAIAVSHGGQCLGNIASSSRIPQHTQYPNATPAMPTSKKPQKTGLDKNGPRSQGTLPRNTPASHLFKSSNKSDDTLRQLGNDGRPSSIAASMRTSKLANSGQISNVAENVESALTVMQPVCVFPTKCERSGPGALPKPSASGTDALSQGDLALSETHDNGFVLTDDLNDESPFSNATGKTQAVGNQAHAPAQETTKNLTASQQVMPPPPKVAPLLQYNLAKNSVPRNRYASQVSQKVDLYGSPAPPGINVMGTNALVDVETHERVESSEHGGTKRCNLVTEPIVCNERAEATQPSGDFNTSPPFGRSGPFLRKKKFLRVYPRRFSSRVSASTIIGNQQKEALPQYCTVSNIFDPIIDSDNPHIFKSDTSAALDSAKINSIELQIPSENLRAKASASGNAFPTATKSPHNVRKRRCQEESHGPTRSQIFKAMSTPTRHLDANIRKLREQTEFILCRKDPEPEELDKTPIDELERSQMLEAPSRTTQHSSQEIPAPSDDERCLYEPIEGDLLEWSKTLKPHQIDLVQEIGKVARATVEYAVEHEHRMEQMLWDNARREESMIEQDELARAKHYDQLIARKRAVTRANIREMTRFVGEVDGLLENYRAKKVERRKNIANETAANRKLESLLEEHY